jgi:hypothetical protein
MRATIGRLYGFVILSVAKYPGAIRYSPPLWFDKLTTNGLVNVMLNLHIRYTQYKFRTNEIPIHLDDTFPRGKAKSCRTGSPLLIVWRISFI